MITINYGTGPPSYALGVRWVQLPVASVRVGGRQAVQWAHMHNLNHVCTCAVSAVDEATCVCVGRVSSCVWCLSRSVSCPLLIITFSGSSQSQGAAGWGTRDPYSPRATQYHRLYHHFNLYAE